MGVSLVAGGTPLPLYIKGLQDSTNFPLTGHVFHCDFFVFCSLVGIGFGSNRKCSADQPRMILEIYSGI